MEQKRKHSYTYFHCTAPKSTTTTVTEQSITVGSEILPDSKIRQDPNLVESLQQLLNVILSCALKFERFVRCVMELLTDSTRCCSSSVRVPVWSTTVELWRFWWRRFRSTASTARWNINATRSLQTFGPWKGETDWLTVCVYRCSKSDWLSVTNLTLLSLCFVSVGSWCVQMWWPEASISPMLTGCCSTILPAAPGNVSETDVTGSN